MTAPEHTNQQQPNRLIHATSPYLLQHAYNPVDWYEWSEEALTRARDEQKPILVSIGYSSCHWCHVMERESFEKHDIAKVMNDYFICIKVDREERPDIDQVYMDAVQAMGMNGGWPLNVFLTSDQKPFYGGTYFQPQVWQNLLHNVHKAYSEKKYDIHQSAEELTRHLSSSDLGRFQTLHRSQDFREALNQLYTQLEKKFDHEWGGMDKAPKFIMPSLWQLLLRYHYITQNNSALQHITFTLKKILQGGIYDQLGGGFARYSVDAEWFVPHFEKMLYDNAQLLSLYAEGYAITQDTDFKAIVFETVAWLQREMTHAEGGFYSALDADSEGVEGKYYCWNYEELLALLGDTTKRFCDYYEVSPDGNWEHGMSILKRAVPLEEFLTAHQLTHDAWEAELQQAKTILLNQRERRIKPGLDDKILAGWNAMMITGLLDAYQVFRENRFLQTAYSAITFLETNLMEGEKIFRSFKGKRSGIEGFLEDYAYVIQAYIHLYQADFNEHWLYRAEKIMHYTLNHFYDPEDGLCFYTSHTAEKLIARKKELFDNVIPSSNSVMARNLLHLGILTDRTSWKELASSMVAQVAGLIQHEPNYMSHWGIAWMELENTLAEVAIVGQTLPETMQQFGKYYLPFTLFSATTAASDLPLLKGKTTVLDKTTIYVCRNYSCQQPALTVDEAIKQIHTTA
jgi:uncharacterized protein